MYGLSYECVRFDLEWPWKVKSRSSTSENVHFQFYLQHCYSDCFDTWKTCSFNRFILTAQEVVLLTFLWILGVILSFFLTNIQKSSFPEPLARIVWNLEGTCLKSASTKIIQGKLLQLFFYFLWIFFALAHLHISNMGLYLLNGAS